MNKSKFYLILSFSILILITGFLFYNHSNKRKNLSEEIIYEYFSEIDFVSKTTEDDVELFLFSVDKNFDFEQEYIDFVNYLDEGWVVSYKSDINFYSIVVLTNRVTNFSLGMNLVQSGNENRNFFGVTLRKQSNDLHKDRH